MSLFRRNRYYRKCQHIIDDLHQQVEINGYISEKECVRRYGKAQYNAFRHELHLMGADRENKDMRIQI